MKERRALVGTRSITHPCIPDLGYFNSVRIEKIPLCPANTAVAQEWSRWLLETKIDSYATEAVFNRWMDETQQRFPRWKPVLPGRETLAVSCRGPVMQVPSKNYWLLQAALDWKL